VDVIHGGEEGEVALVLDYPESEAAPLQRSRYGDDVSAYFVDCHGALIDRYEFNVSRIGDGVPDELPIVGLFEPTAKCVVPPQVCVDGVIHGRNVALAGHLTRCDDLPGKVQSSGCPFAVIAKVLRLHVADWHRCDRRSARLFLSRGRRMP
jgi:hypothetical protein